MINSDTTKKEYDLTKDFLKTFLKNRSAMQESFNKVNPLSFNERKKRFALEKDKDDHKLKQRVAWFLISFLSAQTLLIFLLMIFQGFSIGGFELDNYLFYILITGTIIENYFLVRIIVEHLFPKTDTK